MTVGTIGTYEYMAPEQWVDAHDVDARTDIFAFGMCLYEMFCGQRPYALTTGPRQEAPEPRALRGDETLPEQLCALLKRCVDWDRERRPGSVTEVRQALCVVYESVFRQPSGFAQLPELSIMADGLNNRAVSYLSLGREEAAIRCWQESLKEDPQPFEATYNYSYFRWHKGELAGDAYVKQMRSIGRGVKSAREVRRFEGHTGPVMEGGTYREAYRLLRLAQSVAGYERSREVLDLVTLCGARGLAACRTCVER